MKLLQFIAICIWVLSAMPSVAQDVSPDHQCGTVEAIERSLSEHPELLQNLKQLDLDTKEFLTGEKAIDSVLTIPVVFHVFHQYGSERIGEGQMKDCIRIINLDFQKKNSDTSSVSALFQGIIGKANFRFRLAKKDPNGKCTKGINYINSPLTSIGGENLKNVISWDTKRYLNIWVCQVVASGAAAYSYYPGTAPGQSHEGVVSLSNYVGSIGTSNPGYAKSTLTHEIGHFFNLPHTWGNSNTPGLATNCSSDDGVDDTPNCIGVGDQSCNLNMTSCNALNNVENFMEYSSCRRMFTKGQATRMQAAISSGVGYRNSLWTGSNLIFTGTTNDGLGPECPPTADFKSNVTRVCVGAPVSFTQLAYNVDDINAVQFNWTFNGGTPEVSTSKTPQVTFAQGGTYDIKLVVQNVAGKDSAIRTSLIKVIDSQIGYLAGESEGFESTTFPSFPAQPEKSWDIESTIANTWKRTTTAHTTGAASLMLTNSNNTSGSEHTIYSPVFELQGPTAGAKLVLKYAFAQRIATNTDKLIISYSIDCGKTWYKATTRTAANLVTANQLYPTGNFVPTTTEWEQMNLSLLFLNNMPKVWFKFEFTGGGGNNLYIDDIQITTATSVSNLQDETLSLSVVPNPSVYELPKLVIHNLGSSQARIEIVDALGRNMLLNKSVFLSDGSTELNLSSEMDKPKPGSYWVCLVMPNRVMVRQMMIMP